MSVKREPDGAAGTYIDDKLQVGDVVDASAPRGNFTLSAGRRRRRAPECRHRGHPGARDAARAGGRSVAAASLVAPRRPRTASEHPFAEEARALLEALPHGHSHIRYSSPDPDDRPGLDFDARGRLDMPVLQELGVPRDADFYVCGPPAFMSDADRRPRQLGRRRKPHPHRDFRRGSVHDPGHRRVAAPAAAPAGRAARRGAAGLVRPERPRGPLATSLPEPARACRGLRRPCAMVVPDGGLPHLRERARAAGRSATSPTRSTRRRTATC